MGKTKKYDEGKMRRSVRREILKERGEVHLPAHKVHKSNKDYKRLRKQDIDFEDD